MVGVILSQFSPQLVEDVNLSLTLSPFLVYLFALVMGHFMKKLLWSRYGLYESFIWAVSLPLKNLDAHPSVGEPAAQHIVELV